MTLSPLNLYITCSRLVFNVQPSEVWEDCEEFESSLRQLYESILCKACDKLLTDPVIPKKHHFSCQHRVCLDCIGKKRLAPTNCKMCSDYSCYEKSHQTKLVLRCFQELCELVQSSWIYDYLQRRTNHDTGQCETISPIEIVDAGINYGRISIVLDDTSSDETSNSSDGSNDLLLPVPYSSQIFPNISPLSPVKQCAGIVQSSEPFTVTSEPVIPISAPLTALPIMSPSLASVPQIVQYQSVVQSQLPSTSKVTRSHQPTSNFIKYPSPLRMTSLPSTTPLGSKPIMSPMKVQTTFSSSTPTIYSVMYTGSGNKITLKRKPPEDAMTPVNASNNVRMTCFVSWV